MVRNRSCPVQRPKGMVRHCALAGPSPTSLPFPSLPFPFLASPPEKPRLPPDESAPAVHLPRAAAARRLGAKHGHHQRLSVRGSAEPIRTPNHGPTDRVEPLRPLAAHRGDASGRGTALAPAETPEDKVQPLEQRGAGVPGEGRSDSPPLPHQMVDPLGGATATYLRCPRSAA